MKRTALYTVLSASALIPSLAISEELEESYIKGKYLYNDQVNALKTPTPILNVPQSLSIVDAAEIADRGFTAVSDIVAYIPGINVSQGEGHRDAVVFRGVRSTAAFFIDGVRDDVQYYRPLYNLEQVEVLRGPNALLFGRGGTGGVINRVTKKAQLNQDFTNFAASVDSFGAYSVQVDTNIDAADKSAFRINLMYENLDNHRDFFDGERFGFNPTAKFELSDATTLDLSYEYVDHERFIDRGIPTGADGRPVEAFEDIVFGDESLNETKLEAHLVRAKLQHHFSETFKARVTAAYSDYDKLYQNLYASSYDQAGSPNVVGLDGYVDTTQRENFIVSADLIGEFETGSVTHTVVAGFEYIDTANDNDRYNTFWSQTSDDVEFFSIARPLNVNNGVGVNASGDATVNDFTADLNDFTLSDVEVISAYIQNEVALTDQWQLVLGARLDSFDQSTVNVEAGNTVSSRKDDEVSPRLGLIYKPQENVSFYASYSETFLPRSGEQFASTGSLAPDVFEQSEIGLKWDFTSGLSLTAAYFENDQVSAATDDDTGEDFEIRGLEIEGFELQLQGNITEQLSINVGYSYLEGETDRGREIPRELPEDTFSVWTKYQVTEKFGVGLGATYQSESFINDFDIGDDASTHPTLPSYTRVDASAYYDINKSLRVQLNIENLTDELYFPSSHSTHQATVGAPLNARLSVSGRF